MASIPGYPSGKGIPGYPSSPAAHSSGGGGWFGGVFKFIEHLGSDIKDTAFGIPTGLVMMAEHPIKSVELMAKSTWHDWSPLFHGDVGKEWSQFLAHPLAPILDVSGLTGLAAAPFTFGLSLEDTAISGAAREVLAAGDVGKMADSLNAAARLVRDGRMAAIIRYHDIPGSGEALPVQMKVLSKNPLIQARQVALARIGGVIDPYLPKFWSAAGRGEAAFERELMRRGISKISQEDAMLAAHAHIMQAVKAGQLLSHPPEHLFAQLFKHMHEQLQLHALHLPEGATLPHGWAYVTHHFLTTSTPDNFERIMRRQFRVSAKGDTFLTKNADLAMKSADGHLLIAPRHSVMLYGREGVNSSRFLKALFTRPAQLWKLTQVGFSPKMVLNTAVGNTFMVAMTHPASFLHLWDGIRALKGDAAAVRELIKTGEYKPGFIQEHFRDVIHSHEATIKAGTSPVADTARGGRIRQRLGQGFYPAVHKTEQALKAGVIISIMHGSKEVKALMRDQGLSFEDAASRALAKNPALRDQVAREALTHVGNYQTFSSGEKRLRNFIPFYSWDRHILQHTAALVAEHPTTTAGLAAVGNQGNKFSTAFFGQVPDYMLTNVPLSLLGVKSNALLDTRGLNPYSSVGDLVGAGIGATVGKAAGQEFAPSEDLTSQLNPMVTGLIEGATGTSMLTGKAIDTHGGPYTTAIVNMINSLPEVKAARLEGFGAPQKKNPPLYADTLSRIISRYVGVPLQEANLQSAHAIRQLIDNGGKKKKKASVPGYPG